MANLFYAAVRVVTLQEELEYERLRGTTIGAENMSTVQQEIQREAAKNRGQSFVSELLLFTCIKLV